MMPKFDYKFTHTKKSKHPRFYLLAEENFVDGKEGQKMGQIRY